MRNFKIFLLILLIPFSSLKALKREYAKAGLGSLGYLTLFCSKDFIADNGITKKISKFINADPQDLTAGALLGSFLWGSSYLVPNQQTRTFLRAFAITPPLVSIFIPGRVWKKISRIPLLCQYFIICSYLGYIPLGSFNTCPNKNCEGICNRCKIRRLYQSVPLAYGIYKFGCWGTRKLFPTEFEKNALKLPCGDDAKCSICLVDYSPDQEIMKIKCHHHMCGDCGKQAFYSHIQPDYAIKAEQYNPACLHCMPKCPICKETTTTKEIESFRLPKEWVKNQLTNLNKAQDVTANN